MEKQASLRVIAVKYPLGLKSLSGFSLLFLLSLGNLLHDADGSHWYMHAALTLLFGGCLIWLLVRRTVALKAELALSDNKLTVNGVPLAAESLGELRIDRGRVGLLPRGRRIVPARLCLALQERSSGIALLRWAEKHGVPVRQGSFMRWP